MAALSVRVCPTFGRAGGRRASVPACSRRRRRSNNGRSGDHWRGSADRPLRLFGQQAREFGSRGGEGGHGTPPSRCGLRYGRRAGERRPREQLEQAGRTALCAHRQHQLVEGYVARRFSTTLGREGAMDWSPQRGGKSLSLPLISRHEVLISPLPLRPLDASPSASHRHLQLRRCDDVGLRARGRSRPGQTARRSVHEHPTHGPLAGLGALAGCSEQTAAPAIRARRLL